MAGPRLTVEVEGLREVEDALIALGAEIGPTRGRTLLRQSLQDIGRPIAADAAARAHVGTGKTKGQLRRSIRVAGLLNRSQRRGYSKESDVEVHVGPSGVPQAIQEEFGNVDRPPHPFMRPAWEAGKMKALEDFKGALWARIEKGAKAHARRTARLARAKK